MKNNDGLRFWQRYSGVYDLLMRKDAKSYDALGRNICGELNADMDILELATGTGLIAERVAGCCKSYVATDYSEKMLARAKQKKWPTHVSFWREDATALSFAAACFDAVIIANALHIMPEPGLTLANIRRVLRPGGKLIAPNFVRQGGVKEQVLEKPMHWFGFRTVNDWSPQAYTAFLEEQGWHIRHSEVIPASFDIVYVVAEASV